MSSIQTSHSPTAFQRGEIYLVNFPYSDLSTIKRRPALVIQSNQILHTRNVIVVQITSNMKRIGIPSHVPIYRGTSDAQGTGLLADSVIITEFIMTLDPSFFFKQIGNFANMKLVDTALKYTLDLP